MSLYHRVFRRTNRSDIRRSLPLIEPLEDRQLFSVQVTPVPDLSVLDVRNPSLPAVLKVNHGAHGSTAIDVGNVGVGRFKGRVVIELQLSPDGQWDDANPLLKTVTKNNMRVGANHKRTVRIKLPRIPGDIAEGTYHIAIKITVAGEAVSATGNNTGYGSKTTVTGTPGITGANPTPPPISTPTPTPTFVDLQVTGAVNGNRAEIGTKTTVTLTITNVGTAQATGPIHIDVWAGPYPADLFVGSAGGQIDLAPGESKSFTAAVDVPDVFDGPTDYAAEIYDVDTILLGDTNKDNDHANLGTIDIVHPDVDVVGWALADTPGEGKGDITN